MEKFILITVILCLCIGLCACEKTPEVYENADTSIVNNIDENNERISDDSTKTVIMPDEAEHRANLAAWTMSDYQKLLDSTDFPADFVEYSKISQFGNFKDLIILSDAYSGDFSRYMYTFTDMTGYRCALRINHSKEPSYMETFTWDIITEVDKNDMRQISQETMRGKYYFGGLTYRYVGGKLLSIDWVDDGIKYSLNGDAMLYDYPLESATFVGKMLNLNEALTAVNSIFGEIDTEDK